MLDHAVSTNRFNINNCIDIKASISDEAKNLITSIRRKLTPSEYKAFKQSIIRNSFLIEPVNDDITSTKFETHWSDHLSGDVRFASYDLCYASFLKLLRKINTLTDSEFSILREFFRNPVVPYEMPIDYIDRFATPIHTPENIDIFLDEDVKRCINLRKIIRNQNENPAASVFQTILSDKIKIKTYFTDRALTGTYKTNREKRWEAHPRSVQYALRRECMRIEIKLLLQAATFEGCCSELVENLQNKELLSAQFTYCRCPITGDNIQYREFENDVLRPKHGRSKFQVGHLNPLKAQNAEGAANGHTADNISWISENGNRIQGSLSIEEVDTLLKRIYINRPELRQ